LFRKKKTIKRKGKKEETGSTVEKRDHRGIMKRAVVVAGGGSHREAKGRVMAYA